MQTPAAQRRPRMQAALLPQVQTPDAEQVSARAVSQTTQVPPFVPQAMGEGVMQALPAQQPLGQEVPLHRHEPPTQVVPGPHAAPVPQWQLPVSASHRSACRGSQALQLCPPRPHVATAGAVQTEPAQHPEGQDWGVQVHMPDTQLVPAPQAAFVPQRHSPVAAQLSARDTSQVTHAAPPDPEDQEAAGNGPALDAMPQWPWADLTLEVGERM